MKCLSQQHHHQDFLQIFSFFCRYSGLLALLWCGLWWWIVEDSPDQDRSITDAELEYLQVGGLIFYYLQDYFEKYVSVNINQLRVIAKHHLDKTSENYGRHQYHHQCRHIIIFQNTVGVTAREATAKPPWRAMMTSKAVG